MSFLTFAGKIDKHEAGEYRGFAERMLENYPDHPGLLVIRVISESLSDDVDSQAITQDLKQLVVSSGDKYGFIGKNLLDTFTWMIDYSIENNKDLTKIIVLSLIRAVKDSIFEDSMISDYEDKIRTIELDESEEMLDIFVLTKDLKNLTSNVSVYKKFFNDREIVKLLG